MKNLGLKKQLKPRRFSKHFSSSANSSLIQLVYTAYCLLKDIKS